MKKIVIVGGGFAGSQAARELEKDFAVTLIDTKDYFEFTPGILRTVVEPGHMRKIQSLHSHYLHHSTIVTDTVTAVDATTVRTKNGMYAYDYLVIASGSSYNPPIKESCVVIATRAEHLREHHQRLDRANSVLIIGGGVVGVELAAEIVEHYPKKQLTIIHAHHKLIERNSGKATEYATDFLVKRGVKIRYNERVIGSAGKVLMTDLGNTVSADMAFMCTGIVPNYEFMKPYLSKKLNERNLIKVNEFLQVEGLSNVFAVGDINDRPVEKTAQNSKRQADIAVKNIRALKAKRSLIAYASKPTPMVISLGKWHGVFAHGSLIFTGLVPGLLKSLIEKKEMWRYH
ncbi:MAG: FAD-dependent oxidoreductase [bacterium]|nr:FAD-dependent oxidoreductase [bacterium]